MKKYFNLTFRKIIESCLLVLCVMMIFIAMASKKEFTNGTYNVWQRGFDSIKYFTGEFILAILAILNIIATCFTIAFSVVKNKKAYLVGIIWNFITVLSFFIINSIYDVLTSKAALVFDIIFILLAIAYYVACLIINPESFEKKEINKNDDHLKDIHLTNVSKIFILACCIVCLIASLISLFIPLFTIETATYTTINIPIHALTSPKGADLSIYITFVVLFVINLANIALFLNTLSYFKNNDGIYIKKSRDLINLNYVCSIVYFLVGLSIVFFINREDIEKNVTTFAYYPFIIMSAIMVIFAIASVNLPITKKENKEKKFPKFEMLLYTILFTILPIISIFLKLIVVEANDVEQISIKAYDIIKDHNSLSGSYQLTAFFVIVLLILALSLFILTLAAFFKNKNLFYKLSMNTILVDMLFIFAIGTFGFYYKIVQAMNEEKLTDLFAVYGFTYNSPDYEITSQTMYIFFVAVVLLILVLIRNPLKDIPAGEFTINAINSGAIVDENTNNDELKAPEFEEVLDNEDDLNAPEFEEVLPNENDESIDEKVVEENPVVEENIVNKLNDFDACPAFSELDLKEEEFLKALEERKAKEFSQPSLVNITKFIVDYARESRLHLSYSLESVATFIAGLGACRLSILQGMSGTGKTSLPKIFLEAIMGNCEIVEVESSWRDKNELLGYYNEFSKTFTPKKFTQALYKARLNDNVPTFIVLDEMNLSRIEYYFSDFLSLMENEEGKREIKLLNVKLYNTYENEKHSYHGLSEDHTIKIPSNIWFIGTANRDESTFEISDKVYDRAHTMNFNKRAPKAIYNGENIEQRYLPYDVFASLLNNAKSTYEFDIDKNNIIKEVERILAPYNISFGNRISGQIENFVKVYCSCFDNPKDKEFEAVETILLSKVVAKLENKSVENKEVLIAEFNKLKLKKCVEFVSKLNED